MGELRCKDCPAFKDGACKPINCAVDVWNQPPPRPDPDARMKDCPLGRLFMGLVTGPDPRD